MMEMMERMPIRMPESNAWRIVVAATIALLFTLAAFAMDASPAFAAGTVNVSVQGKGDTSGPGINCNESGGPDCSEFYADATFQECDPARKPPCITITEPPSVTLTAGADRSGYVYEGWTGCDTVTGRNCDMTVTANRSVIARFRDAQAPSVFGLSPGSGVQAGTINISAAASDNSGSVSRMEFRVRGALIGTDMTAPFSASFNTTSVADGAAEIRATAFDAAGNASTATASTVTIDNTAPTLSVTGGPDGQTFGPGSTQTWTFAASDATSGVASVQCSVVAAGSPASFGACSGGNASHSVTGKPDGDYTFSVRARDNGGLETTQNRTFSIDAAAPTGTVKINGGAIYTRSPSVNLSLSASDSGSGIDSMRLMNDGGSWSAWMPYATSKSWTLKKANGTRTVYAQYKDKAGNVSTTTMDRILLDTLKPTISAMSPRNRSITRDKTPTIKATVRDNMTNLRKSNIKLYVAGKRITTFRYSVATDKLTYTSPRLTQGKKVVKIVARDAAGSVGAKIWYFTIKK